MKCHEFDQRIHLLLDQRRCLQDDRRLRQHAHRCSRCRRELEAYKVLFQGLDLFEPPETASDFAAQVVRRVHSMRPPKRIARPWMALWGAAIAAGLLIALAASWIGGPSPSGSNRSPLATDRPAPGRQETPGGAIEQLATETGSGFAPVAAEPIRRMLDQLAPELPYEPVVPVEELAGGLRPITDSLVVALDVLRNAIPLGKSGQSKESTDTSALPRTIPPGCISV